LILEYNPEVTARATVSNDTACRMFDDAAYLIELGYRNLAMIPVPECEWTESQFVDLARELRKISDLFVDYCRKGEKIYFKHIEDALGAVLNPQRRTHHCGAGRGCVAIDVEGQVWPCHRFSGDSERHRPWRLGNVWDGFTGEKRNELLEFNSVKKVNADCENCLAVNVCGCCCIAVAWMSMGDIYTPPPSHCRIENLIFREGQRIHYLLSSENCAFYRENFINKYRHNGENRNGRQVRGRNPGNPPTLVLESAKERQAITLDRQLDYAFDSLFSRFGCGA
jgi:uncharacterized protein